MSKARTISFKNNKRDTIILKAYEENGKSDFAKNAMWDYLQRNSHLVNEVSPVQTETKQPSGGKLKDKGGIFK